MAELTQENNVAFRVAHLSMIQGAITRMSSFSASAKTFTITILAGLAAISLQAVAARLGFIAMAVTIVLAAIDTYYMTMELRFRASYDEVVARDLGQAADLGIAPLKQPGDVRRAINSTPSKLFYIPVLFACVLLIGYGEWHDRPEQQLPRRDTPCVEQRIDAEPAAAIKCPERIVRHTNATSERSLRNEAKPKRAGQPVPNGAATTGNR